MRVFGSYIANGRALESVINIKKSNSGYDLYKSSFYCNSAYQRIILLFNYIQYMTKIVAYYICAKNKNDITEINTDIITDTYDKTFQFILDNVSKNDYLHDRVKRKIEIPDFVEEYLMENIVPIIGVQILGSSNENEIYMSFAGLGDLLTLLRNKVQSHGNINESNISFIEKTIETLVSYFNEFIALDEIEIKNENKIVNVRYANEKFISLNKYAVYKDNNILLLQGTSKKEGKYRYINYFNGKHNKPSEVDL